MLPATIDWLVVAALTLPHLLYAFVWMLPDVWLALYTRNSKRGVCGFERSAWFLKCVQLAALLGWYRVRNPAGLTIDMEKVALQQWVTFVALAGVGQALNLSIYDAIGSAGVYYGTRLGVDVPWHNGFPFTFVAHPQYIGSAMTIWAVTVVLFNQGPASPGVVVITVYWTLLYTLTALQEQFL